MPVRLFLSGDPRNKIAPFVRDPRIPYLFLFYKPPYKGAETEESLVIGDTANHVILAVCAEKRPDLLPFADAPNLDVRFEAAREVGKGLVAAGSIGSKGTIVDYFCREWNLAPPDDLRQHDLRSAVYGTLSQKRMVPSLGRSSRRPFMEI